MGNKSELSVVVKVALIRKLIEKGHFKPRVARNGKWVVLFVDMLAWTLLCPNDFPSCQERFVGRTREI